MCLNCRIKNDPELIERIAGDMCFFDTAKDEILEIVKEDGKVNPAECVYEYGEFLAKEQIYEDYEGGPPPNFNEFVNFVRNMFSIGFAMGAKCGHRWPYAHTAYPDHDRVVEYEQTMQERFIKPEGEPGVAIQDAPPEVIEFLRGLGLPIPENVEESHIRVTMLENGEVGVVEPLPENDETHPGMYL
jgi:hypothetical protein